MTSALPVAMRASPSSDPERRRAVGGKRALRALGLPGHAHAAAVVDERVAEERPLGTGEEISEVALDLDRVVAGAEPEAVGQAEDVSVHDHALVLRERGAEDHVRGLARD